MNDKNKKALLMTGGEVGGIGKSTTTKLILEYFTNRADYELYDLDSNKPDVGSIYAPNSYNQESQSEVAENNQDNVPKHLIRFSDDDHIGGKVDIIFEECLNKFVIANLPSNSSHYLKKWILDNDLIGLAKSEGIQFIKFFVCVDNPESVDLFQKSLELYQHDQGMQQVLVFNEGKGVTYEEASYKHPKLKQLVDTYKVPVLVIPKLNSRYYGQILSKKLTFNEAKTKTGKDGLKMIGKSAVTQFLKTFETNFTKTLKSLGGSVAEVAKKEGRK